MLVLDIKTILNKIANQEVFEAQTPDLALHIKINEYVPFVCTALHNGGRLRDDLLHKCILSDYERWYEEDPKTRYFVSSLPIVLCSNDTRYEYDLNRSEQEAVYKTAWGKQVWRYPLNASETEQSLMKYQNFYEVAEAIIGKLESLFSQVNVFDIHSYNYKRIERETPVFNLGTRGVNEIKYSKEIANFIHHLEQVQLSEIPVTVKKDDVFEGRGHFTLHISRFFRNTLVFPLEIKKVYCDELTGEIFEDTANQLKLELTRTIEKSMGR